MAQDLESIGLRHRQSAGPAESGQEDRDALKDLIAEGLNLSAELADADITRYRRLLSVLFDACILGPPQQVSSPTPSAIEQAHLTIAILLRQINAQPSLLFHLPPSNEAQVSLYKWVIPKLITAAAYYVSDQSTRELFQAFVDAAVRVISLLRKEEARSVTDHHAHTLTKHLVNFCKGGLSKSGSTALYGVHIEPQKAAVLATLGVLIQAKLHFADLFMSSVLDLLSDAVRVFFKDDNLRRETIHTLALAIDLTPLSFVLAKGCCEAMSAENDDLAPLFQSLRRTSFSVQHEVWHMLRENADQLSVQRHPQQISFILSLIDTEKLVKDMSDLIEPGTLDRWKKEAGAINEEVVKVIKGLLETPPTAINGTKRKRDELSEIEDDLQKECGGQGILGEDTLEGLAEFFKRRSPDISLEATSKIAGILRRLLMILENKRPMLEFELWTSLAVIGAEDSQCWLLFETLLARHPATIYRGASIDSSLFSVAGRGLKSRHRRARTIAGRALSQSLSTVETPVLSKYWRQRLNRLLRGTLSGDTAVAATAMFTISAIGRQRSDEVLGDMLELLVEQLGSPSSPLRSLAFAELLELAKHYRKSPYFLIYPFMDRISVTIVRNVRRRPDVVAEATTLLGQSRQNFVHTTLAQTLPTLVLEQDKVALETIASIVNQNLVAVLLDKMTEILVKAFMNPSKTDQTLSFIVGIFSDRMDPNAVNQFSAASLVTSCHLTFAVALVVELGDDNDATIQSSGKSSDLGAFLKPIMLGIMTHLNETLHDIRGKKTVDFKRKLIRSLGTLIHLVGDSMASYSPQVMATLQSTLGITELRSETLDTWAAFVHTLKYSDLGPFVGRTTGALVAIWTKFNADERRKAVAIVTEIADNAKHFSTYVDEVVGLDSILELRDAARTLTDYRKALSSSEQMSMILDRVASKNIAVASTSIRELRHFLSSQERHTSQLSMGDTFDFQVASAIRVLLEAATRDGDCEELRDMALECLGIVGALDPDRLTLPSEPPPMTILSNFSDNEESINFVIHLIRDVLVDAFRATNDTKLQAHLAYAIQELLQFCGFEAKMLSTSTSVPLKIRDRWQSLPKDQLETLTPLLESRFSLGDIPIKKAQHPIYDFSPTYREWLQTWTTELIGKVMSSDLDDRATRDRKRIFGVFRGVLRNQDVTVAHHLLPHLVLNTLLSGDRESHQEIRLEIISVLQDQVNPRGAVDKRTLSAQVIFDLMDHLSRWLRLQRTDNRPERGSQAQVVDSLVSQIETELMANAALQSKAYARSLRNFEQRIVQLRDKRMDNADLQTYFERLHQIYSELDEPDGMEGVSTFVIAPSLEHQVREHESMGQWTSAQSCWEVRLQQSPDDLSLHIGLLKCLQNLGHYDTLSTHIRGVLGSRPEWSAELAHFEAESAWITGDWHTVEKLGSRVPPLGRVLLGLQRGENLEPLLTVARRDIGRSITSRQYGRVHQAVLRLHQLREVEVIHQTAKQIAEIKDPINESAINKKIATDLVRSLDNRFNTTSPAYRIREAVLTIRRTAFSLVNARELEGEIGHAWIQSSKIARKAGYEQTAYTAALQAKESDAPFAFVQQVKLLKGHDGVFKALGSLENSVNLVMRNDSVRSSEADFAKDRQLAKAVLLEARWAKDTDRFEPNEVVERFRRAIELEPSLESPYYHLGHYYDTLAYSNFDQMANANQQTCHNYIQALHHGVKYIYQTMPRMLTLWLDLAEHKELARSPTATSALSKISSSVEKARKDLPTYQFLTAFPQIVSRIGHPKKEVSQILRRIMATVIKTYPQQALWPTVGVMQSNRPERKSTCMTVIQRAQANNAMVAHLIREADRLSSGLLRLADDKVDSKKRDLSVATNFPYVKEITPSKMIMPLQDALTTTLPMGPETIRSHVAFPMRPVEIAAIHDRIEVMPSLQRPKKLIFIGTDGRNYPFLCKPHDDLRKDARLMDFNSMINKLLKSASESRRRQLYIRTYAVMPLNEECGLLEWVANTNALKGILECEYARHGKKLYTAELQNLLEARKQGNEALIKVFKSKILPLFSPSVFHQWFMVTWPEPTAWLASRMAYSRTLAVMSMIGYVLGLGDRHCENILFDGLTGDTVHVDLNCLFDKGKTFDIPERVPFRLTHNMVDALGVTGVEGVFRKAAEITMGILRINTDSLMSVLEAFAHDPLVEWSAKHGRSKSDKDIRGSAEKNLQPIRSKLRGQADGVVSSVHRQVDQLIKQATSASNLALMYQGWAPYL